MFVFVLLVPFYRRLAKLNYEMYRLIFLPVLKQVKRLSPNFSPSKRLQSRYVTIFGFYVLKFALKAETTILWKLNSPISKVLAFKNLSCHQSASGQCMKDSWDFWKRLVYLQYFLNCRFDKIGLKKVHSFQCLNHLW